MTWRGEALFRLRSLAHLRVALDRAAQLPDGGVVISEARVTAREAKPHDRVLAVLARLALQAWAALAQSPRCIACWAR